MRVRRIDWTMKTFAFRFVWCGLAALALAVTGCHTVSTSLVPYVGVPKYPPSDPTKIEILQKEPTRPHEKLGEVVASPDDGVPAQKIEEKLRSQAAKLGADAVVLTHDKMQVVGTRVWGPYWAPESTAVSARVIVVIAIKYK
jgi:hypothetical protein